MGLVLLVLLVLLLMGALPRWNHSREWGYAPTGGLGLLLLVVIVLAILGSIPWYGWNHAVVVHTQRPVVIDRRPITIINPPAQPNTKQQPPAE